MKWMSLAVDVESLEVSDQHLQPSSSPGLGRYRGHGNVEDHVLDFEKNDQSKIFFSVSRLQLIHVEGFDEIF